MQQDERRIVLYTDGSCTSNGCGASAKAGIGVYEKQDSKYNLSEGWRPELGAQTNQRAELVAAIRALEVTAQTNFADENFVLEIRADSMYVVKGITEWIKTWKRSGWRSSSKKPVANADLWHRLDALSTSHPAKKIVWTHVRGHVADEKGGGNAMADRFATAASSSSSSSPAMKRPGSPISPPDSQQKRRKIDVLPT